MARRRVIWFRAIPLVGAAVMVLGASGLLISTQAQADGPTGSAAAVSGPTITGKQVTASFSSQPPALSPQQRDALEKATDNSTRPGPVGMRAAAPTAASPAQGPQVPNPSLQSAASDFVIF